MTRIGLFGCVFGLLVLFGTEAIAQEPAPGADLQTGKAIARQECSVCHTVPDQPWKTLMDPPAPSFVAIANRPDATARSVFAFLQSTHKTIKSYKDMPELKITDDQSRAVAQYIMSLRTQH